ncbi:malonyl-CoA decarboxylase-domain-containing protein [Phycomyces blakesleeanus]
MYSCILSKVTYRCFLMQRLLSLPRSTVLSYRTTRFLSVYRYIHRDTSTQPTHGTNEQVTPSAVLDYWSVIRTYVKEPGFFSFSVNGSKHTVPDATLMRTLLHKATTRGQETQRGTGDLLPSVVTAKCCEAYGRLDQDGKSDFFHILAEKLVLWDRINNKLGVDRESAAIAAKAYITACQQGSGSMIASTENILRRTLEPLHNVFFDQVSRLPGGLKFLTDMRADLHNVMSQVDRSSNSYQVLGELEVSLKQKLKNGMIGFLKLERITWQTSAEILEKISRYEAVHAVADLSDMKRRLGPDRRLYSFFHSNIPMEPLVFVQVALVPSMACSIQAILQEDLPDVCDPNNFKCAICYSITTQRGLGGVDLGNFLIKRVVRELKSEYPQIETFATLSPLPRFRHWLMNQGSQQPDIEEQIRTKIGSDWRERLEKFDGNNDSLKDVLMRLCARQVQNLKKQQQQQQKDMFWLKNAANWHKILLQTHIHFINIKLISTFVMVPVLINSIGKQILLANKGIDESFGIMINYNYLPEHIEFNNKQYLADGSISVSEPRNDSYLSEWIGKGVQRIQIQN